tara:strand:- start:2293 stop:2979 length:687 start_codon:yes stop_codon:yes gene_type:complete
MENVNNLKDIIQANQQSDYLMIIIALFFCIVTSFILMHVYKYKSNSLSSKSQIAPIIPLLSNITFLVILIVKSSLALSLGLVGALSVIRFRTPIKEPEDLAFLFLSIALGIGYGALQIFPTTIVFLIIVLIIWFFLSKRLLHSSNDFNLLIEGDKSNLNNEMIEKITSKLKDFSEEVRLIKIEKDSDATLLFFRLSFNNFENITNLTNIINKDFDNLKFSIYENKIID